MCLLALLGTTLKTVKRVQKLLLVQKPEMCIILPRLQAFITTAASDVILVLVCELKEALLESSVTYTAIACVTVIMSFLKGRRGCWCIAIDNVLVVNIVPIG